MDTAEVALYHLETMEEGLDENEEADKAGLEYRKSPSVGIQWPGPMVELWGISYEPSIPKELL